MVKQFIYPITFLPTANLEKTRQFYENVLQLPIALDQNTCLIFKVGDYGYWGFCTKSVTVINPEEVCLTLFVGTREEVDEWHDHLINQNVEVKRPPQYSPTFKIYNGFYYDPSGYTIEIQAFDTNARPAGAEIFK